MSKKSKSIPVKYFDDRFGAGITIEKIFFNDSRTLNKVNVNGYEEFGQTHRHDRHSFFLLESGTISIEIDFQKYEIRSPSVIYMHPNQVHRTLAFKNVTVSSLAINNENLNPEYLEWLEEITPTKPLSLKKETFSIISEAVSLCLEFSERKDNKLYHSILKDFTNGLVALITSQYVEQAKSLDKLSRFEIINKSFKELLERNFITMKSPTGYAQKLNISTPYLNECVKNATGYSVSHHIQQRIILEAKRLLYHSDKSVKEIAVELGYDNYPYFSRLFTNISGMTPLTFRNKNHD
jgi:AraC-like DNA-binding protein/mannose-6-phosphate isomerase-like protein (cupin superfamily)